MFDMVVKSLMQGMFKLKCCTIESKNTLLKHIGK